jgi:hypothetical protein
MRLNGFASARPARLNYTVSCNLKGPFLSIDLQDYSPGCRRAVLVPARYHGRYMVQLRTGCAALDWPREVHRKSIVGKSITVSIRIREYGVAIWLCDKPRGCLCVQRMLFNRQGYEERSMLELSVLGPARTQKK